MERRLERDDMHKSIAGVCAGLANYLNVDIAIVRAAFIVIALLGGASVIAYIVLWIVMPRRNYFINPTVDYRVPPEPNPFASPFTEPKYNDPMFSDPQFQQAPYMPQPRKQTTTGIIIGAILIVVGLIILVDNFDLIPDIDFDQLWPVVLILAGVAVVFSGKNKKPWKNVDWHKHAQPADNQQNEETTTEQL